MKYISTRNKENKVTSLEAVLQGIADDGGLFVPEEIPDAHLSCDRLRLMSYPELTAYILNLLLPDFGEDCIRECVEKGYEGKFDCRDLVELKAADGKYLLELYHGPTSAFKDMALCVLPRLLTAAAKKSGTGDKTVILTATSGDTGKAALEGFADVPGTEIFVFYPKDGVSEIQYLQMATQEGANTHVSAITGNFDDAQTAVKKAFPVLNVPGCSFSSANSINIGRLAPQVAYYFWTYRMLYMYDVIAPGDVINFVVPTGNFGDILAGWLAKRMGLPVGRLCCASNENRILTDFLSTGVYDKRRDFYLTASPSMDILVSSNLERLLFFASGKDDKLVAKLMNDLNEKGVFSVSPEILAEINKDFDCACADDGECFGAVRDIWRSDYYLMDTHTAVAYACAKKVNYDKPTVILSTASPFKFAPAILKALTGEELDGFDAMRKLERVTGRRVPEKLRGLKDKAIVHRDVTDPLKIAEYITETLEGEING